MSAVGTPAARERRLRPAQPDKLDAQPATDCAWLRRLHVLLGVQSLLLVLGSVNRLSSLTGADVLPNGSLRVAEVVNLLVIPPLSALALAQPAAASVVHGRSDVALVLANAALVAAAIIANLAFEPIGLDLVPVALIAAVAVWLWLRYGPRLVTVYFASSYVVGLVVVAVAQAS